MANTRKRIMLVDDNKVNLDAGKGLLQSHYEVYPLPSAAKMFEFLEKVRPDLILLDVEMPEMSGFEAIKILKVDERYKDIPVIFLTALSHHNDELAGLSLGAIDYVFKPYCLPLLLQRIENHLLIASQKAELLAFKESLSQMVQKQTEEIFNLQHAVISSVAEMVEFRDDVTGGHVTRTQEFMRLMVEKVIEMGIYGADVLAWNMDFLIQSALMHDVGKIAIPDTILSKPGKLTPEEWEIMKTHAIKGIEVIQRMTSYCGAHAFLTHAATIAGTHHEKWDGTGYPNGLKGAAIPLEGRIMAIADVYDALISTRPYKEACTPDEAAKIIIENAGTHFDPVLVDVFKILQGDFKQVAAQHGRQPTDGERMDTLQ